MNERIRALAYRAANGMLSYDAEGEWQLSEQECNKFAELIIRECAVMADPRASRVMLDHFGVEE